MIYKVSNINTQLNNEDGLSAVFFEYPEGYFSISKIDDENDLYVEKDDQSFGTYTDRGQLTYSLHSDNIVFYLHLTLAEQINADCKIELNYKKNDFAEKITKVLEVLFLIGVKEVLRKEFFE